MPQRLVACQGSIQLVTAVAVLRQRDREAIGGDGAGCDEHLLITELLAPAEQEKAFVDALGTMAGALRRWKSVTYAQNAAADAQFDDVAEVYVVREWQRSNMALLRAFPKASKICFGDSIGIYLAPTYMAPNLGWLARLAAYMRTRGRAQKAAPADCYYLTLPGAFDPVPSRNVRQTDVALLREAFGDLRPLLPQPLLAELRRRLDRRRLVVLVGSNFSEQGVMSIDAEIAAYTEYLKQLRVDRESLLLLKPHPRDRMQKVLALETALGRSFPHIFTLTDPFAAYLPLETLLLELRAQSAAAPGVQLLTFSSACLAPKYVLDIQPHIGFGEELVNRHFGRPFVRPRVLHERQLLSACAP